MGITLIKSVIRKSNIDIDFYRNDRELTIFRVAEFNQSFGIFFIIIFRDIGFLNIISFQLFQ